MRETSRPRTAGQGKDADLWRRLLDGLTPAATEREAAPPTLSPVEGEPIGFQEVFRHLDSTDPAEREQAATLVAALKPQSAIHPLLRAYLHHGDRALLETLALYGDKLTLVAGRTVRDPSLSPHERARLMDVLGASGDPAAIRVLRTAGLADWDAAVHVAACAALVRLGELDGVDLLDRALHGTDVNKRLYALRATRDLDHPALAPVRERHVLRYLAAGGAVPKNVAVALPLLLDPSADLPALVAAHVARSPRTLTIVIGPEAGVMAEAHRDVFERALPDHQLFFTPGRHSPTEQFDVLARARDAAATQPRARVALVGVLPSPQGLYPPPHFLVGNDGPRYTVRIVFVGQQDFAVIMEWWYYIEDESEIPTDFEVVLTALTLGGDRMTEEEWLTYHLAGEDRRDAFARALLAHRATVGDALEGRSWLY
jgi:hypothetical protein